MTDLFVGNICRSPLAEVVFAERVKEHEISGKLQISSAATSAYEVGNPADHRAQQVALKRNLHQIKQHRAKQLHPSLFVEEQIILICMDRDNVQDTERFLSKHPHLQDRARVHLFSDFCPQTGGNEVIDPYYGDLSDFEAVIEQCQVYSDDLITHLNKFL